MKDVFEWFKESGLTALLSLTAIVVSVIAFLKVHRTRKRLLQIEETREQDRVRQKDKAQLLARLVSKEKSYWLQIENPGLAEARNIRLLLGGKPIMEHPTICAEAVRHVNNKETRQVGPQSSFQYLMALHSGLRPPFDADITWSDDSGEPGHYRTTVTF